MTVVFQFPTVAPTTYPVIKGDPILPTTGAKFLFDFKNPSCYSGAALVNGTALVNLVSGAPNAVISNASAGLFDSATWGFSNNHVIGTNGATAFGIDLGGQYFTDLANNYLVIAYITLPQTSIAGAAGTSFFFNSSNGGGGPVAATRGFDLQFGTGGLNTRVQGTYNSGTPANTPVGYVLNVGIAQANSSRLFQIVANWYLDTADNTWKMRQFFNGVLFGTSAYSPSQSGGNGIQNTASNLKLFTGNTNSALKVHRIYGEDLTISGRNAIDVVTTDWNFSRNRFGVAA